MTNYSFKCETYIHGSCEKDVVIDFKRKLRSQHKITKCDNKSNKFTIPNILASYIIFIKIVKSKKIIVIANLLKTVL